MLLGSQRFEDGGRIRIGLDAQRGLKMRHGVASTADLQQLDSEVPVGALEIRLRPQRGLVLRDGILRARGILGVNLSEVEVGRGEIRLDPQRGFELRNSLRFLTGL